MMTYLYLPLHHLPVNTKNILGDDISSSKIVSRELKLTEQKHLPFNSSARIFPWLSWIMGSARVQALITVRKADIKVAS